MFTSDFYSNNRQTFYDRMSDDTLAVFFSGWPVCRSGDADYPFSGDNDFYYLTGIREPEAILVLDKTDTCREQSVLFIRRADPEKEKWFGKMISPEEAEGISGISRLYYTDDFSAWFESKKASRIYLDSLISEVEKNQRDKTFPFLNRFSQTDAAPILQAMRNIKQAPEIEAIRRGIALTAKGIDAVKAVCHPRAYEYQLQAMFEYIIAAGGAEGTAFPTIVASGVNGPILHYETNRCQIAENTFVLLDLGAKVAGYNSDISRTLFCGAHPSDEQIGIYEAVLEVQNKLIGLYQPGKKMKEIQNAARTMLFEAVRSRHLVKTGLSVDDIYYHGIGHPLGLDTHDLGRQPELILEPGMVMTCEPGLYFADKSIGIRIEDDILITEKGPENLSEMIPKNLQLCS